MTSCDLSRTRFLSVSDHLWCPISYDAWVKNICLVCLILTFASDLRWYWLVHSNITSLILEAVLSQIVAVQAVDINLGSQEALFQDMYLDSLEMPAALPIRTEKSIAHKYMQVIRKPTRLDFNRRFRLDCCQPTDFACVSDPPSQALGNRSPNTRLSGWLALNRLFRRQLFLSTNYI